MNVDDEASPAELKKMSAIMKTLRGGHFSRRREAVNTSEAVIYWEETCFEGTPYDVPLVILRTGPCRWFSAGGCTMCNYELMAIDEGVSASDLLSQVDNAITRLGSLSKYEYVFLTSQGSFFDRFEVSGEQRLEIGRRLALANIRMMSTESEAKYCINTEPIEEFRSALGAPLSIGIGVEAFDPFIRNVIINKGLPEKTLRKATANLSEKRIGFYTYVTLGKPFLTPKEDITDAVSATVMSFELGAFMCVLEMINIQPYTLTNHLREKGRYKPASLWTGIRTLLDLPDTIRHRVSLKGVEADIEPVPLELSDSCPHCQGRLRSAITSWNYHREIDALKSVWGKCECFSAWNAEYEGSSPVKVRDRVTKQLEVLGTELGLEQQRLSR
ncbi:hypothetical protein [Rhizobium alvei]|uniref:Elp3/MiaA/NifB-like radical SAM core domain-containing protein n=1 Tax=Rhizobium alvei TaxID=1132659 RepID=A0ABT8YTP2_9HYPH|nr:hypothetical protein [Rhizobium alvei]MDO6967114.1 hypothetical protein [Rhizobium alvei]